MSTASAPTQKQKLNVYTVMLIISGISLIFGAVCLGMALNKFESYPYWDTSSAKIQQVMN